MVAKRRKTKLAPTLATRVAVLEHDVHALKLGVNHLRDEMVAVRLAVKQIDERGVRGERLLLEMQGEQLRTNKALEQTAQTLERIAATLKAHAEEEQSALDRIELQVSKNDAGSPGFGRG